MIMVSIIVPVYKVEAYLQRCIDSVLEQNFQDWEMILVDDGSPDRCPKICDEAASKDNRIKVLHKDNAGALAARYAGYKESKGEYLVFLDSDDWLLPNALHILYHAITSDGGYDIVKSLVLRQNDEGKKWIEHYPIENKKFESSDKYKEAVFYGKIHPYLHSGIYKHSLFSEVIFEKLIRNNISMGEDWIQNTFLSIYVHRMKVIPDITYVYFWNNNSIMVSTVRSPNYARRIYELLQDPLSQMPQKDTLYMQCKMYKNYISSFFRPEIGYSYERYKEVIKFISDSTSWEEIKMQIEPRYLMAIKSKFFFYLYSKVYCFLYLHIKQHGRKKRVIS